MKSYQLLESLVERFSKESGASLELKTGWKVWTRMDGWRYTDLGEIIPSWKKATHKVSTKDFFEWLKQKHATPYGTIAGPFGSDEPKEAIRIGSTFVRLHSNDLLEWGSVSRLRNTAVWRHDKYDSTNSKEECNA